MNRAFQFARVRRQGASIAGRLVVLSAYPLEKSDEESAFGIICTKKVGCAVMRNTLKRRIRELLRKHGDPLVHGLHVVCVLRWRSATATFAELEKDFSRTSVRLLRELKRAGETAGKFGEGGLV